MMEKGDITIVIPVRDRVAVVGRTLDSVLAQTYRPLNLYLVDNGSTDGTLEFLQQWKVEHDAPDFRVEVSSEPEAGASRARNKGLAAVQTPWTMFFDSDDYMTPDHVARAMRVAASNPEAELIGWNFRHRVKKSDRRVIRVFYVDNKMLLNAIMLGNMGTLHYMARTDIFRRAGGWNPEISAYDDMELGVRMMMLNPRCVHAGPEITVQAELSDDSITTNSYRDWAARIEPALKALEATVPRNKWHLIHTRRVVDYAWAGREDDAFGRQHLKAFISTIDSPARKLLWRLVYYYSRYGGRGVGRILKLLS